MKSHLTKSSLLKNYEGLGFGTFQKYRYILKTSLQGSLGSKKASQIEISLKNQRGGGGWGSRPPPPPPPPPPPHPHPPIMRNKVKSIYNQEHSHIRSK